MIQDMEGEEIVENVDEFLPGSPFGKKSRHLTVPVARPKGRLPPKRAGAKSNSPSPAIIPDFQGCAEMEDDSIAMMDHEMANGTFNSPRNKNLEPGGARSTTPTTTTAATTNRNNNNTNNNNTGNAVNKPTPSAKPSNAIIADTAPAKGRPVPPVLQPQPPTERRAVPPSPRAGAAVTGGAGPSPTATVVTPRTQPSTSTAPATTKTGRTRGASFKRGTSFHRSVTVEPAALEPTTTSAAITDKSAPQNRQAAGRRERGASFKRGTSFHKSTAAQSGPDATADAAKDGQNLSSHASFKRGGSFTRSASFKRGSSFKQNGTAGSARTATRDAAAAQGTSARGATTAAPAPSAPKPPPTNAPARMVRSRPPAKKTDTVPATGFHLDGATMVDDIDPLGKTESQMDLKPIVRSSAGTQEDAKESHPTFSAGAPGLPSGAAGRKRRMSVKDRQRRSSIIRNATLGLNDASTEAKMTVSVVAPPEDEEHVSGENSPSKEASAAHRRRRSSLVYKGRASNVAQV